MNLLLVDDDIFVTTALKTILEMDPELPKSAAGCAADGYPHERNEWTGSL